MTTGNKLHGPRQDDAARFLEPAEGVAWRDPVLVVCPRCEARATVTSLASEEARLVCGECSLTREWRGSELHGLLDGRRMVLTRGQHAWVDPATGKGVEGVTTELGVDARFGTPLWLRTTCCGGKLLWANNEAHLEYLAAFVAGRLREHPAGPAPLSARLPTWLKEAKNRDEVLRHLDRLRRSLL